jgi:phthalate 4,5-cis-dihydrodiol dehydrogenase
MTSRTAPVPDPSTSARRMQVGIAGLGAGAVQVIRAMAHAPYMQLIAAADVRPEALATFTSRFQGRTYTSVEALCRDPEVEVVWISTPNQFHCEHTITAAQHGKHVVVEKPMALTLDEAQRMTEAAEKYGVQLLCGHTASLMAANQAMRRLITSGAIGAVQAINVWSYTDWMFRPRMPQELDIRTGGGIVYRQGPHQVDTVRLLGGGRVRSVRAMTGKWFPGRQVEGYYVAFLEFENGVPATIMHNGYGYFSTYELVPWAGSSRYRAASAELRRAIRAGQTNADQEALLKNEVRFGGPREAGTSEPAGQPATARGFQGDLGLVVVSCARGDVRQSPNGLWVYDDDGQREVPVEGLHDERMAELDEMYQALTTGRPVRHDGRWGTATLEVVLAIRQSAHERREILLSHQCDAY